MKKRANELNVGKAMRMWREAAGWTRERLAVELGCSLILLRFVECGTAHVSLGFCDRFREVTGWDAYILAYATEGDMSQMPDETRALVQELGKALLKQLETLKATNAAVNYL